MSRVVLASVLILAATPAAAGGPRTPLMARVPVHDLDLSSRAGARTMLRRLHVAARSICALPRSPLFPANPGRAWRCQVAAVGGAVERLRAPQLTFAFAEDLAAHPASPQNP